MEKRGRENITIDLKYLKYESEVKTLSYLSQQ